VLPYFSSNAIPALNNQLKLQWIYVLMSNVFIYDILFIGESSVMDLQLGQGIDLLSVCVESTIER